ncbi:MAG: FAD:protein FMN transferase [Deltaproteobacteria bacterium]
MPLYKVNRLLMGTLVQITVVGTDPNAKAAAQAVIDEIQRVENLTSFHKPSALTRINDHAGKGPIKANAEMLTLIQDSIRLSRETKGAFDPSLGPVSRLWNFSAGEPRLPAASEIAQALTKVGLDRIEIDPAAGTIWLAEPGMALDLGGIAKGYVLDRARVVLEKFGVKGALVNAGGDILAVGEKAPGKPWRVGVQDPRHGNAIVAVASVKDKVVVTSGDYERFFMKNGKRYHHILDPRTGYPATGLRSVTIVASDGLTADALATGVFVLGPDEGLKLVESIPGVEALLIDSTGRVRLSSGAASIFELRP